jgi:arginyl-tRNA synthetase
MNIRTQIEDVIKDKVSSLYGFVPERVLLEHPDNEKWGDYATNISLEIAGQVKQSPMDIAKKLCYEIQSNPVKFKSADKEYELFESVEVAAPGFINFKLSSYWLHYVLYLVNSTANDYGTLGIGAGKKVLVEYSQPNPNKSMHIGHARNNFLGSSISYILRAAGYEVVEANYMNDWGRHICMSMLMYKKYYAGKTPDKKSDHFVGDLYALYERKKEEDPAVEEELAEMFVKLEKKDPETVELWKKITGWVYEGWQKTYSDQQIEFDVWMFQSDYTDLGKDIVNIALEKGLAEKDGTGAVVAKLEEKYGIPDKVLLRSDGTSLYSTQDLQLAKDSFEKYELHKRLYVVDFRQSDYFKQIFKILELLGFEWATNLHHVAYGIVKLPEGNMSSRKGLVVSADEVLDKLVDLEIAEMHKNKGAFEDEPWEVKAKKVALAAYKYGLLKVDSSQDIVFDIDQATRFEGNTGPYIQYTYARAYSLLDKAFGAVGEEPEAFFEYEVARVMGGAGTKPIDLKTVELLRFLYRFPEEVEKAASQYAPHIIANYLFTLSQRFNKMYAEVPILTEQDIEVRNFYLQSVKATSRVIQKGLSLLGIETVKKM